MSLRFTWRLFFAAGALVIHSLIGAGPLAEAQTNGGFESGFLGFETIGNATIQGDTFAPTEGSNLALLTTDDLFGGAGAASVFDVEAFLGAAIVCSTNHGSLRLNHLRSRIEILDICHLACNKGSLPELFAGLTFLTFGTEHVQNQNFPRKKFSARNGIVTVEFALFLPVMVLICFGSIQLSCELNASPSVNYLSD